MISEEDTIEVPSVGGRKSRILPRQLLSDIIQPRAEEICHLIYDEITRAGYERVLNSGVVFTGGSASLEGLAEVADRIFDMPIRCGTPTGVGGLLDVVANPAYATSVGLVLYAHRVRANKLLSTGAAASWRKIWERFRKMGG
jgi:cell division protein FtsA